MRYRFPVLCLLGLGVTACTAPAPSGPVPVRIMGSNPAEWQQRTSAPTLYRNTAPPQQPAAVMRSASPQVVSVSPYAGQRTVAAQQPAPSRYNNNVPVTATHPMAPQPAYRPSVQPSTPAYRPPVAMPPPAVAVARPIVTATASRNLSIGDVIDSTIKNAPDERAPVAPVATPPAAAKPSETVAASAQPVAKPAIQPAAHQPSKQDIARLGGDRPQFYWPVRGQIVSAFGAKGSGKKNDGINISAPRGTAVRAAAPGLVVYSGTDMGGLGNLVLIRHSGGYHTAYAHVENILVKTGDKISNGEAIANVGKSGNVTTPQLHFEIRQGKQPVNPENQLPRA